MRSWAQFLCVLILATPLLVRADAALGKEKGASSAHGKKETHHARASKRRAMRAPATLGRHEHSRFGHKEIIRTPHGGRPATLARLTDSIRCPEDMVAVAGRVCVDRYETSLIDAQSGKAWAPFYAPNPIHAQATASFYEQLRMRAAPNSLGALMAIPEPPDVAIVPRSVSLPDVLPQGYLTADSAESACESANKRLCTEAEWVTACQGEGETEFPYGQSYEQGTCNVYRESHPSFLLHDNAARYHDDPRNNLVAVDGRPLLEKTGSRERCASRWGADAVYDMVGNLDEWVADDRGVFVGGFYSRGTRSGCFSRVSNHPRSYSDYSTGARCCSDPVR